MTTEDILNNAKKHCFFVCLNDSGAELCKSNAPYGIAAVHEIQKACGLEPNATFISTPDMTITRNVTRWNAGFGYGGKITWGSGDDELMILNAKPNACGMLVGGLHEMPEIEPLIRRMHDMEANPIEIDGVKVKWDFYKSNHFVDLFDVKPVAKSDMDFPKYGFIIHGSAGELTGDNDHGWGLYIDKSKELAKRAQTVNTKFGEFQILVGADARKYYEQYKFVQEFATKKRRKAAEMLFGEYIEISNETHQGMLNMNEMILGCHNIQEDKLYPLALRGDLPAYIVRGKKNLSPEIVDFLGFEKRAKRLGVYDRLLNANIIPHGGGYVLPDLLSVNKVIEIGGKRYFEVEMSNDRGKKIISEVRELPYEYRGRTVVLRSLEVGLLDIVAKLIPKYVLKI
ncbi:MAG: hypothetical protein LWY06_02245 [Firmicutes bacterium]|nr:hypothetical protein [Bacillota bacterium]